MSDKFALALALMGEAFADAQAGAGALACVDLAAEVDGAQQVINAASALQALRVAQYAARVTVQDSAGQWVEVDHGLGHVCEFASDCPTGRRGGVRVGVDPGQQVTLQAVVGLVHRRGLDRDHHGQAQRQTLRARPRHPLLSGGPTTCWNLASLCKHHHRVKPDAGWALTMTREGLCTWTDPHGRQYATHPTNHHEMAA